MGTRSGGRTPTGPHWTRRALLQRTGTVTLPLEPAEPGEPGVEAYTFSYEFQDEPEGVQETKKNSLGAGSQKATVVGALTRLRSLTDASDMGLCVVISYDQLRLNVSSLIGAKVDLLLADEAESVVHRLQRWMVKKMRRLWSAVTDHKRFLKWTA